MRRNEKCPPGLLLPRRAPSPQQPLVVSLPAEPTPELARKVSSHSVHLGDAEAGEIETMVDVAGISARVNALSPTEKEEVVGQFWDRRTSQSGMVGV